MVKYAIDRDLMLVDGRWLPLEPYRDWLIEHHEQLVKNHFIKTIRVGRSYMFTFDWAHIYIVAQSYGFITDYLKNQIWNYSNN